MKLSSHGTAGARRRLRHHARTHARAVYGGRDGGDYCFDFAADDGRTYTLRLSAWDVEVMAADLRGIMGRRDFSLDLFSEDLAGGYDEHEPVDSKARELAEKFIERLGVRDE